MLVIRRRTGEALVLGDHIEVEVVEITPTRVKLGVRAPRDVAVIRKEVLASRRQNELAAEPVGMEDLILLANRLRGG